MAAGPSSAIDSTTPSNGASNVPISGVVFTWSSVPDAATYDFTLTDASGASVDSASGLTGTSYTCSVSLTNDASYTWQVVAKDAAGHALSTSSESTFRTAPTAPVVPPPTTPVWVWVVIAIGAILVIVTLVLIFRTRRV